MGPKLTMLMHAEEGSVYSVLCCRVMLQSKKTIAGWLPVFQKQHVLSFNLSGWLLLYDRESWLMGGNYLFTFTKETFFCPNKTITICLSSYYPLYYAFLIGVFSKDIYIYILIFKK